jgi:hypothetical protein
LGFGVDVRATQTARVNGPSSAAVGCVEMRPGGSHGRVGDKRKGDSWEAGAGRGEPGVAAKRAARGGHDVAPHVNNTRRRVSERKQNKTTVDDLPVRLDSPPPVPADARFPRHSLACFL